MPQNATAKPELTLSRWSPCPDVQWLLVDNDDSTKEELLLSLNIEHCKAQQNPKQDEGGSEDYTISQQDLYRNYMTVRVFHAFLRYHLSGTEDDGNEELLKGSTRWLARLDAGAGNFVKSQPNHLDAPSTEREVLGGHRQKLYADTFRLYWQWHS